MKKEAFKTFLSSLNKLENMDTLIKSGEQLENTYKTDLDQSTLTEEEAQEFRTKIYFDDALTPWDKKWYPKTLKLYYEFIHNETLPPLQFKTKGQNKG